MYSVFVSPIDIAVGWVSATLWMVAGASVAYHLDHYIGLL
jgi:hypothetical protein